MKNNIYYSQEARRDLDAIWDYLVSELQSTSAAEHTVSSILDAAGHLETFPEMGAPLSSIFPIESDYRFLVRGNYLIFYRTSGEAVYVDRILYGRRDYLRILFEDFREEQ